MRIGFVGGGNMARALIGGLQARHDDASFVVIEPHAAARDALAAAVRRLVVHDRPSAELADCDAVVLAVKPQQLRDAATSVARWLHRPLVVSIAAGVRTTDLARWLADDATPSPAGPAIVRAMPNTPAMIGEGITGLYAMPAVDDVQRTLADTLMTAVGQTLWVDDEARLDAVTAVSGSGPAYVFAFIEALERGATELGFAAADARRLAIATFLGASRLAAGSDAPVALLREQVTSKGGTTFAALTAMSEAGVGPAIVAAVHAAATRSSQLGDEFGRDPA